MIKYKEVRERWRGRKVEEGKWELHKERKMCANLLFIILFVKSMGISYYFYIGLEGICALVGMTISWKLYTIRDELRPKFLDETKSLLIYPLVP
jgi:hypothetical protein